MNSYKEIWAEFQGALESHTRRLLDELDLTGRELQELLESQKPAWETVLLWRQPLGEISSLDTLFEKAGRRLLDESLDAVQKARVLERLLDAIGHYGHDLEEVTNKLPETIAISRRELAESILRKKGVAWIWLRWQRRPHNFPLRAAVQRELVREALDHSEWVGSFLSVAARNSLDLVLPWQALRGEALRRLVGLPADSRPMRRSGERWLRRLRKSASLATRLIRQLRARSKDAPVRISANLLRAGLPPAEETREKTERLEHYYSYWRRQVPAVAARRRIELELAALAREVSAEAERVIDSVQSEQRDLLRDLDAAIAWLEALHRGEHLTAPSLTAQVVPAETRLENFRGSVTALALSIVARIVETVDPTRPLPGVRPRWRQVEGQAEVLKAFDVAAWRAVRRGLDEAESLHRMIEADVERSCQVVAYGEEVASGDAESGLQVKRDAVESALRLVSYRRRTTIDTRPALERAFVLGIAAALRISYLAVEARQSGFWRYLRQEGLRPAARLYLQLAQTRLRGLTVRLGDLSPSDLLEYLRRRGWIRAPLAQPRVERWAGIGEIATVDAQPRELPIIHRRLFRLDPLEDPRFLVGREEEMAAMAELRGRWQSGRVASAIVVGEPGSGKTSLLNCAALQVFSDLDLVRCEFRDRIRTPEEMRHFLRRSFQLQEGPDPVDALPEIRRVVMLEGLERAYLRQINGYQGLRDLLRFVTASSDRLLWILTVNHACFQVLQGAVHLGQYFSYRINAGAVGPKDIENAIQLRQNLSGWRLQFHKPSKRRPAALVGLDQDPERMVFSAVYEESQGIFRDALEIWQGCIERAEEGFLYVRQPARRDHESLSAGMLPEHLFSLHAILLHAGLTIDEHSCVLQLTAEESRTRLEALADIGMIEPDPAGAGFRVRSSAARLIRHALRRHNLL